MSDQTQDELALVLRRISSLSRPLQPEPLADDIPVLTDIYQGRDALSAVEIEQLLAAYYDSNAGDSNTWEQSPQIEPDSTFTESGQPQQVAGIKFLPIDDGQDYGQSVAEEESQQESWNAEPEQHQPVPDHQELAEALIADMQPLIAQAIHDAMVKEMEALTPRLSANVEQALAERLQERVAQALKGH